MTKLSEDKDDTIDGDEQYKSPNLSPQISILPIMTP